MILHVHAGNMADHEASLDGMFKDRKRVFVDRLGWKLTVIGQLERDQYDDRHAEYILIVDPATRAHRASMRLLRTERPHLLSEIFPMLCDGPVPTGPDCRELTRLCVSPDIPDGERRHVRNKIFTAVVMHALAVGIERYSGVAYQSWLNGLLQLGWQCTGLGPLQDHEGQRVGAFLAEVTPETPGLFRNAGTYAAVNL